MSPFVVHRRAEAYGRGGLPAGALARRRRRAEDDGAQQPRVRSGAVCVPRQDHRWVVAQFSIARLQTDILAN